MKTKFELFKEDALIDMGVYREKMKGCGSFEFVDLSDKLQELQNKLNKSLLQYLFGERLGEHYTNKFIGCDRNLLHFFNKISHEEKFFMLYELKTNQSIYSNV